MSEQSAALFEAVGAAHVAQMPDQFRHTIPEKDLIKVYKEKSLVLNKQVTFMENDQLFSGVATDVTNQGHLLVTLDNGQEKLLRSGEISLSSWQ